MARRWRNYTDLPDEELKAIYNAVLPPGLPAHDVEIKNNAWRGAGTAYTDGSRYHKTGRPFVVVRVPTSETKARHIRHKPEHKQPGYLPVALGNRREVFLYILAHELRHLWQGKSKGKPRGMVWGARGKMSERDACAYGMQMLRRYRRGELLDDHPQAARPSALGLFHRPAAA